MKKLILATTSVAVLSGSFATPAFALVDAAGCAVIPGLVQGHQHLHDARLEGLDAVGPVDL